MVPWMVFNLFSSLAFNSCMIVFGTKVVEGYFHIAREIYCECFLIKFCCKLLENILNFRDGLHLHLHNWYGQLVRGVLLLQERPNNVQIAGRDGDSYSDTLSTSQLQ